LRGQLTTSALAMTSAIRAWSVMSPSTTAMPVAASARSFSGLRASPHTRAPSASKRPHSAPPMKPVAPVTKMVLFFMQRSAASVR
jgi:hypothetical protein